MKLKLPPDFGVRRCRERGQTRSSVRTSASSPPMARSSSDRSIRRIGTSRIFWRSRRSHRCQSDVLTAMATNHDNVFDE